MRLAGNAVQWPRRMNRCSPILIALFAVLAIQARAEFPQIYNSDPGGASPPSAPEALKMLHLPKGFTAQIFAAEPDVMNPIAMDWDHRGRMWAAENFTYAERSKRFDLALRDRVIILQDKDGDGVAETRKVFLDNVQMLTSVAVGRGGVWLMCPPQVLFVPDADGDDVPDGPPVVVLDGFTVADANYHNFANGLRWGPDGWLYGRCGHSCPGRIGVPGTPDEKRVPLEGGIWRFQPERKVVEALCHGTTNPWGHDWDENGECFFINTVNGHLWHVMPGAHFMESFGADPNPAVYERLDMIADHWHFDRNGGWQSSRDGKANSLGGGHAHIGMMVYQGDQWPQEYRGKLFTLNMHGRRANVEKLEREGCGYVGRHTPDVFLSDDPWFRGIEISTGPDGSGYILDWSDTGECHDSTGVHRESGRIYRVTYGKPSAVSLADLDRMDAVAVVRLMKSSNAWFARQCQLRLRDVEDKTEITVALRKLLANGKETVPVRLRALWALNQIGAADVSLLKGLLSDTNEHIRVWAIRLLTDSWLIDGVFGPINSVEKVDAGLVAQFTEMARSDGSGLVRLTLASTLQRLPINQRAALGRALASRKEDGDDRDQPSMVWYGLGALGERDPMGLVAVAGDTEWPGLLKWTARMLASRVEKDSGPLNALLQQTAGRDALCRQWVTMGLADAFQGWRRAPKPEAWDAFTAGFTKEELKGNTQLRDLSALFGDGRALDEVKKVALDGKAELAMREAALQTLIDNRPPYLRELCESLLEVRGLNGIAVRGLGLFDDPKIGVKIAQSYRKFGTTERPAVIDMLCSRAKFAEPMLAEMAAGKIPKTDLTAFHARQINTLGDAALSKRLVEVWGEVRESAADKQALIARLKKEMTPAVLAKADLKNGRVLFQGVCGACHTLYGIGGKVGPDLTGSGRANLDYLLENVADPSAVIGADYRMIVVTLKDGRILSGVAAAQNEKTLTLRMLTEETVIEKSDIVKQDSPPLSMMPEGLLLAFQPNQVRDLLAYLMSPRQVD